MIRTAGQIAMYRDDQIVTDATGGACSMYRGEERYIRRFGG